MLPLPLKNGGKCQCQPSRSASVLSPANTQHSGRHKDEGAHSPAQGFLHINTANDKAPCTVTHEAHLLPTLFWIFISRKVCKSLTAGNFQKLQNIISTFSALPLSARTPPGSLQPVSRGGGRSKVASRACIGKDHRGPLAQPPLLGELGLYPSQPPSQSCL